MDTWGHVLDTHWGSRSNLAPLPIPYPTFMHRGGATKFNNRRLFIPAYPCKYASNAEHLSPFMAVVSNAEKSVRTL